MSNRPVRVDEHIKKLNPTAATLLGFLHRGPMVFFGRHLDPARKQRFLAIHRLRHEQAACVT